MNKSGIAPSVISHPKGGGAFKGIGESFAPDAHTGTGNLTVPFDLPVGRNGFQPALALAYSTGNGNGLFGLGWQLGVPAIARDTSHGVPSYDDDADDFLLAGAERLVAVGGNRYRPRTETNFARIEHRGDVWEVRTRDGLVSRYGATIRNPDDHAQIFAWSLTQTVDCFGNRIEYAYERDEVPDDGPHRWDQLRLSQIRYIDHGSRLDPRFLATVDFVYEDRPDPYSSYRSGFEIRTIRRCARIETRTHAEEARLVRRYAFRYGGDGASLLTRIEVEGVDGGDREQLPPLEFGYTTFRPEERAYQALRGALPERSLAHPDFELADVFGCGLPDLVQIGDVARYWKNLGSGRFDLPRTLEVPPRIRLGDRGVMLADADGDGHIDLLLSRPAGHLPLTAEARLASFVAHQSAPPFELEDPEVRLVDLDGDGVADALRTGSSFELYYRDAESGWSTVEVRERDRLERFPDVYFSDPRVKLADMTGDGLTDIVFIDGDRVDYWPYLGRGRWAERVTMRGQLAFSDALRFGGLGFDPKRVLLGDVDGDGLADLVYVESGRVTIWLNRAGNGWSEPVVIHGTPPITDMDAVRLADIMGTGTAGILWSYDAGTFADSMYKFLDLTGGTKPYLLNARDNHSGARTRIEYAPSTRFYLGDDVSPETRWRTRLPFPVQVVARVEVIDDISHGRLTTEYRYHHGYWDGEEREFRGFAMVEQLDAEVFDRDGNAPYFSPPTLTRTWFHQGEVQDASGARYESLVVGPVADPPVFSLADRDELVAIAGAAAREGDAARIRQALRALRGSVLRTELFALDDSPDRDRPFDVSESLYDVREIVRPSDAAPGVFASLHLGTRSTRWERGIEPMTRFRFTTEYDVYGQALGQLDVAIPRGRDPLVTSGSAAEPYLATYATVAFAQRDDADRYLVDRVAQSMRHEVVEHGRSSVFELRDAVRSGTARRRRIGHERSFYDGDAFEGLPSGRLGDFGALVRREALAFEDAFLAGTLAPGYLSPAGTWTSEYPAEFRAAVPQLAGYLHDPSAGYYVILERRRYDFQSGDAPRGAVREVRDPLGAATTIELDPYDLLPIRSSDAAGLVTEAAHDYRTLSPRVVTDANGTSTEVRYSPTGMLVAQWVRGKHGEGDTAAPSLRFEYDVSAFELRGEPMSVRAIRRIHHDTEPDVAANERDATIESVEYSDGFGRMIHARLQAAEPDQVVVSGWQRYDNKGRVVEKYEPFFSTGWAYRPPSELELGQKVTMFYDARGQLVRTVKPDGSEALVVMGVPLDLRDPTQYTPTPWESFAYDANDNAGRTHAATSSDYRSHWNTPSSTIVDALGRVTTAVVRNGPDPATDWFTSHSAFDIQGNLVSVTDPLGREAFRYTCDLAGRCWRTESIDAGRRDAVFDALGRTIEARDAKGALMLQAFDRLHRPIRSWARDSATAPLNLRTMLAYGDEGTPAERSTARESNLLGRLVSQHDGAGLVRVNAYDFKGSIVEASRRVIADGPLLDAYVRAPTSGWDVTPFSPNWTPDAGESLADVESRLLEATAYEASTTFDALGRVTTTNLPRDLLGRRRVLRPHYNRAGALDQVRLDGELYIEAIAYDALARRVSVAHGNGARTRYTYDARSLRLVRLHTETSSGPVQDLSYAYDLVGNILAITDRIAASGIPDNPDAANVTDPVLALELAAGDALIRRFDYDPAYRLVRATGRECDRPADSPPWFDEPRCADVTRTRRYVETYDHDAAGNLRALAHRNVTGGFTRGYTVEPTSNRLRRLELGPTTSIEYVRDANGNTLAESSSRHFDWDFADQLKAFRTQTTGAEPSVHAQYLYDAAGTRVKKLVRKQGGRVAVTHYIDGTFEHHRWGTGENNHIHVADGARRVATLRVGDTAPGDSTPSVTYELADHLGSVNAILDRDGDLVNREELTPYGETSFGSYARKRYRFTGVERDEESSLSYHGARYYAPWLSRWTSCDPIGLSGGANLYAYASGNPLSFRDTRGTEPEPAWTMNSQGFYEVPGVETINVEGTAPDRAISNFVIGAGVMSAAELERQSRWRMSRDKSDYSWLTGPPDEWSRTVDPEEAYAEDAARRSEAVSVAYAGYIGGKAAEWEAACRRMATAAVVAKVGVAMLATAGVGSTVAAPYMVAFGPHVLKGVGLLSFLDHVKDYHETGDERAAGRALLDLAGASIPGTSSTRGPLLSGPGGVDPGLADFVIRLEAAGIKVLRTNIGIAGEGRLLGEIDVVTENALIQFKSGGSSARDVIKQVRVNTEPYVTRPVVTFISGTGADAARTVRLAGRHILITDDFKTLVDVIK